MTETKAPTIRGTWGHEALYDAAKKHGMMPVHPDTVRCAKKDGWDCPESVPMSVFVHLEQVQERCAKNHSQTPERLRERGGLAATEMLAVLRDEDYPAPGSMETYSERERVAMAAVLEWFSGWGWTPWTIEDACQGNVSAIRENFRQMIGALCRENTLTSTGERFVRPEHFRKVAEVMLHERLGARGTNTNTGTIWTPLWGDAPEVIEVAVTPHYLNPFDLDLKKQPDPNRRSVTFRRASDHFTLWISPPWDALVKWARQELGQKS